MKTQTGWLSMFSSFDTNIHENNAEYRIEETLSAFRKLSEAKQKKLSKRRKHEAELVLSNLKNLYKKYQEVIIFEENGY